jgi:hypothetical protein
VDGCRAESSGGQAAGGLYHMCILPHAALIASALVLQACRADQMDVPSVKLPGFFHIPDWKGQVEGG